MRFSTSVSALTFAAVALAQDVTNGQPGLVFDPPSVNATKGSVVTFVFDGAPGNHTVAQSSFQKPCEPLPNGFDSGYIFVPQGSQGPFPTFNLTIEDDTKPIWFYCAQSLSKPQPHCISGMVGAINAPTTNNTFDAFQALAKSAASVVPPSPALSGVNAIATAGPGPLTGSFSGAAVPTGTAPAGSGSSGGSSGTSSSSGASPTKSNGAGTIQISGVAAFLAAAFGVVLA
ncbi:hypothetical protein PYCCODRAFT_1445412 [Trametes coccinea BRFM310]|uniref:Cupredoxin n=1 Tax=Trametes coccinea (strain BRFM310) TaxID=1353009 RepID=A0A1Y2ILG1_TRAC3|nr:hypothetical protein PYCCODRAFT_1445412 [Trametes coccinea BRFM310]